MQTNILDWLEATAAHTPEGAAVGDAQQDYTWAQLAENARRAGSFLAGHTAPRCRSRSIWKNPRRFSPQCSALSMRAAAIPCWTPASLPPAHSRC